jgi:hypothetical protein
MYYCRIIFKYNEMKKLFALFLVATALSCGSEDQENQNVAQSAVSSESVLDGKMLSFKDEESFVKEYSDLAILSKDQLQKWISDKKVTALLNTSNDSVVMQEDIISKSRLIYSDALKSILNAESKVKIGNKMLWLNERSFYLLSENEVNKTPEELFSLKDKLEVYGQLLGMADSAGKRAGRGIMPNENLVKTFVSEEVNVNGTRHRNVVEIFNETIYFSGTNSVQTSKMYLRTTMQYRSCSTWRCSWKENMYPRTLTTVGFHCSVCDIGHSFWSNRLSLPAATVSGSQMYLLAEWRFIAPVANPHINYAISGTFICTVVGHAMPVNVSWY